MTKMTGWTIVNMKNLGLRRSEMMFLLVIAMVSWKAPTTGMRCRNDSGV